MKEEERKGEENKKKYPGTNCLKQTRDNGKNEARDVAKRRGRG